ncbi:MAG: SDR family NAD(P)-dependent oxidoreductase [Longimicrobiales bacterium]
MTRTALITGASRGLGATLASFLAGRGWDLIIDARGSDALDAAAAALRNYGGRVRAIAGDIVDAEHRRALVAAANEGERLDLLVNNASVLGPSPLPPLAALHLDSLHQVLEANAVAPLALVQAALPLLESTGGLVVNVTSDAARGGYAGWGAYGASKAALELVSLTLATELRDRGVGVVTVDPGDMRTAMHQAAFPGEDISDRPLPEATIPFWAWLLSRDPMEVTGRRLEAQADRWEVAA